MRAENGTPIADARVSLARMGNTAPTAEQPTDAEGVAAFPATVPGVYYATVAHPDFAERVAYGRLPGDLAVTLRQGARLNIVLSDFPSVAWTNGRLALEHQVSGLQKTIDVRAREEDAGRWPEGTVHISLVGNPNIALANVAMPAFGNVTLPLSTPRRVLTVVVRDSLDSGAVVTGWHAGIAKVPFGVDAPWEPVALADAGGGTYAVSAPRSAFLLLVEKEDFAPTIASINETASTSTAPLSLVMRRGCAVEASLGAAHPPCGMQIAFVALAGQEPLFLPVHTPLAADRDGTVFVHRSGTYPALAVLARAQLEPGATSRAYPLPPNSVVAVSLADGSSQFVRLGDSGTTTPVLFEQSESAATCELRVLTPDHRPAGGAQVTLQKRVSADERPQTLGVCSANADGSLVFAGLDPGTSYEVQVVHQSTFGHAVFQREGLLGPTPVFVVVLGQEPSVEASVRVTDDHGQPWANLVASFCVVNGPTAYTVTDGDGVAHASIPVGERAYVFVRLPDNPRPVGGRWPGSGEPMPLVVPRKAGSLSVGLTKTAGSGVVTLVLSRAGTQLENVVAFVDGAGVMTFRSPCAPGRYHVSVQSDGGKDEADTIVTDEDSRIDLTVP